MEPNNEEEKKQELYVIDESNLSNDPFAEKAAAQAMQQGPRKEEKISQAQSNVIEAHIENTGTSNKSRSIIMTIVLGLLVVGLIVAIYYSFFRKEEIKPTPKPDPVPVTPDPDPDPVPIEEPDNDIGYSLKDLEEYAVLYYKTYKGVNPSKVHARLQDENTVNIQLTGTTNGIDSTLDYYTVDKSTTSGTNLMGERVTLIAVLDKICVFKTNKKSDNTELASYCKEKKGKVLIGDVKNTSYAINKEYVESFVQKLMAYGIFDNEPEVLDRGEVINLLYLHIRNFNQNDYYYCYSKTFMDTAASFVFNKKVTSFPSASFSGKVLTNYYCPDKIENTASRYSFVRTVDKGSTIDVIYEREGKQLTIRFTKDSSKYVLSSVKY